MNRINRLKVLVYGGTGSQARPLVLKLLERGHIPHVLTRQPEKAASLQRAGAVIINGDLNDIASLRAANEGMDAVALLIPAFLANPLEAETLGRNAVEAAGAAGVKLIVWNTSGPMPERRTGNSMNDLRLELIEYLAASGLAYISIEPTVYMENWLHPWTAAAVATRNQVAYPIVAERRVGWITSNDVGALVVAALERPELAGSHFKASGLEAPTGFELAGLFSEALRREITYYAMTPEEMGEAVDQVFGPGQGKAVADSYRREREAPNPPAHYHDMRPVLEKLPVKMTTIMEWVAQHAQAFTPAQE